ncbi:MAG TPA: hypothetical protein VH721_09470 [Gaiellaceae bacterium]|jgi:hypothetical protein
MRRSLAIAILPVVALGLAIALPAAVAAKPKPSLKSLAYLGLGSDVAGRLAVAIPNGERDAQFSVTLTNGTRTVLKHIVLQRMLPGGAGYAEGWDTNPGTSASILAVVLDGKRLNKVDRDLNAPLAPGTHRLVLYANDHYGVFAPGQLFRVTAAFPDLVTASTGTKLKGAAPTISARFVGLGTDVVGRGTDQKPNGEPDAHFAVTLDTHGSWQIIDNVVLRRLNAQGALDLPIFWMQGPQTAGLFVAGTRYLWPTEMPWWISVYVPVNPKASPVTLDLYANDPTPAGQPSSLFGPGQQYRLTVHFTDSVLLPETSVNLKL